MKISDNFILKKILDDYIVVPMGSELVDFNAIITLNETGAFLWEGLTEDSDMDDLCDKLCDEYEVDRETALKDTKEFIEKLKKANILENE